MLKNNRLVFNADARGRHLKCIAAVVSLGPPESSVLVLGTPYFGVISWQLESQYTPPAADSGCGIGDASANSRSSSSSRSTSAIRFSFSLGVSHFFIFTK